MRIVHMVLKDHKKIMNGLGEDLLSVHVESGINFIEGPNGVGKSTLLSELTPFPSDSSNWIDGVKIVWFNLDDQYYYVAYFWKNGKPVNADFFKFNNFNELDKRNFQIDNDMLELMRDAEPMTNKHTFAAVTEALSLKLGLDPNFEALTCLSSYDNKSFALLRPAERKKFLNTIVQNLDVYNNIYKTLSKRSSIFKAMVGSLNAKISSLGGNPLDFSEQMRSHQKVVGTLYDERDNLMKQILAYEMTPAELAENNNNLKLRDQLQAEYRKAVDQYNTLADNYNNTAMLNECIDSINVKYVNLRRKSERDKTFDVRTKAYEQKHSLESGIVSCKKNIYEYSKLLNDAIASEDYKTYAESVTEVYKERLKDAYRCRNSIEKKYDAKTLEQSCNFVNVYFDYRTFENFRSIFVKKLEILDDTAFRNCDLENPEEIEKFKAFADKYFGETSQRFRVRDILDYKHRIYDLLKGQVAKIDGKDPVEELDRFDRMIMNYQDYRRYVDIQNDLRQLINQFRFPEYWVNLLEKYVSGVKGTYIHSFVNFYEDISNYNDAIKVIHDYELSRKNIKTGEALCKQIQDYREFITQNETQLKKYEIDLAHVDLEIEDWTNTINVYDKVLEDLNDIIKQKDLIESTRKKLDDLNRVIKPIPDLVPIQERLANIDAEIKRHNEILYKLRYSFDLFNEYIHELETLEGNYSRLETLKKHCSPTSGIQIIFIDLYINKILEMANSLLSMFFGGEFVIQPFKITDKEFQIPVKGNGLLIDDISSLSASQMTIVNMCISFAIMMHSSSKLNILRLDEMDAPLDGENSRIFPDLVNKVMSTLKCEQAFIITHSFLDKHISKFTRLTMNRK